MILGVNVDHVATLRQARGGSDPEPVMAASLAVLGGADGITVHLREDRRHINDRDLDILRRFVPIELNLEMAATKEILKIAVKTRPDMVTLVPEKRQELTTEGGLDVAANFDRIGSVVRRFHDIGVIVSLFVEPEADVVSRSKETGADFIELHTGSFCNAADAWGGELGGTLPPEVGGELSRIYRAAEHAAGIGIGINAGHGLNAYNLKPVLAAAKLAELNIGHSIIARSIFVGLPAAVKELLDIIGGA